MRQSGVGEILLILGEESPREVSVFLIDLPVSLRDLDLVPCYSCPEVPFLLLLALERELVVVLGEGLVLVHS